MREALFILLVISVLLGLTLVRYRKQIAGLIGLARTLKQIKQSGLDTESFGSRRSPESVALVNCSKCGIWVPQDRALRSKNVFFCSDICLRSPAVK